MFGMLTPQEEPCGLCAGLQRYGWEAHDGESFGRQEIVDGGVHLTTSLAKRFCEVLSAAVMTFTIPSTHGGLSDALSLHAPFRPTGVRRW